METKTEHPDDFFRKTVLDVSLKGIKRDFGIDLTWGEVAGLRHYLDSFFKGATERDATRSPHTDAVHYFMNDYFGLDIIELGRDYYRIGEDNGSGWVLYGSGFLGEEKFKEYCRRNVDVWRDERNLL